MHTCGVFLNTTFLLIDLRVGWPVSHLLLFLNADNPRLNYQLDLHC